MVCAMANIPLVSKVIVLPGHCVDNRLTQTSCSAVGIRGDNLINAGRRWSGDDYGLDPTADRVKLMVMPSMSAVLRDISPGLENRKV